jgi:uncharacterized phiE125 gp8 family phage protein
VSSVQYVDTDGVTQTAAASVYQVSTEDEPAWIEEAYGQSWPSTRATSDSVIITYTAGYGAAGSSVPAAIRQAMLLMVGQWYENREPVVIGTIQSKLSFTVDSLLEPYRVGFIW